MTSDNDLERCVTLHELSLRNCPQGFEHVGFGQIKKRATESHSDKWIRSKRQKGRLRQTRLHSEPFDSLPSSRQSTPSATVVSLDLKESVPENLDNVDLASTNTVHKHRDLMQIDIENKPHEKFSYLCTPPTTVSYCSSNNSSIIDSAASTAGCSSSPRSDNDDEVYANRNDITTSEEVSSNSSLNNFESIIFNYPQILEVYAESPQPSWASSLYHQNGDTSMLNDLNSDRCPNLINEAYNTFNTAQYLDCGCNVDSTNLSSSSNFFHFLYRPIDSIPSSITPQTRYLPEEQSIQVSEQLPAGSPLSYFNTEPELPTTPRKEMPGALSCSKPTPEADVTSDSDTIPKSNADSEDERANTKSSAQQASINIFLKNGSIENWNLGVPEAPENVEAHSPSKSTLMAAAEEDLEERVSHALSGNPGVAALLLPKLKAKLSFILPLFCEEEECSPFEFSPGCSYFGYERGTTRKRTSGSTPSTASKSTSGTSITTPATSADSTKDCDGEEDDDELPNSEQPPQKRPRLLGDQDRRRLRCHFHAKSPNTHIQKTCIMSGWLNMHNLRGHYDSHHTVIRCNKCFQSFEKKTEKNQHQRTCTIDAPLPLLEVIDCDKTDELNEVLPIFRTWRLENEEDEEMKNWIIKYKVEFVKSNMRPSDDLSDSRELAKWYRMWRVLFPSLETPVPSPFQSASILLGDMNLERHLEVFQSVVEAQIENGQPPPAGGPAQIEYYKDAIRTVYRMTAPAPGSSAGSMSEGSHVVDGRSISTPADSTAAPARLRAAVVDSSPSPAPRRQARQRSIQTTTPGPRDNSRSRPTSTPSAALAPPSNISPVGLPSSINSIRTELESPVAMTTGELRNSSGIDAPPSRNPPDFHVIPQNRSSVPSQHNTSRLMRSATHPGTRTMLPPPSPSRVGAPRSFHHQDQQVQTMQHLRNENLTFPPSATAAEFQTGGATSIFNFAEFPQVIDVGTQVDESWSGVEMTQEQSLNCQLCFDYGQVRMDGGRVVPCYVCQPPFGLQS